MGTFHRSFHKLLLPETTSHIQIRMNACHHRSTPLTFLEPYNLGYPQATWHSPRRYKHNWWGGGKLIYSRLMLAHNAPGRGCCLAVAPHSFCTHTPYGCISSQAACGGCQLTVVVAPTHFRGYVHRTFPSSLDGQSTTASDNGSTTSHFSNYSHSSPESSFPIQTKIKPCSHMKNN